MNANTLTIIIVASITILFSGIGILLIMIYQRNKKKASASLSWPETKGTVIKSKIKEESSVFSDDEGEESSQPMYSADISYNYLVDGMLYTSDQVSFAGKSSYSKREKVEEILAGFPEGASVSVFYKPDNPQESVLQRTAKGSGALLGAGIVFLSIGILTLIVGIIILM
jgi:hypothetical protein